MEKINWIDKISALCAAPLSYVKNDILNIFSIDLDSQAEVIVDNLFSNKYGMTLQEFIKYSCNEFKNFAQNVYWPILVSYVDRILKNYSKKWGSIVFLARDGIYLYEIAKKLAEQKYPYLLNKLKLCYFTRSIAWQKDEIAWFEKKDVDLSLLKDYLNQCDVLNSQSLLVDIGMYGSLYKFAQEQWFWTGVNSPWLVFLFSKNPNIEGYLNQFSHVKNSYKLFNIIADGIEWLNPQTHYSPQKLIKTSFGIFPEIKFFWNLYIEYWHRSCSYWYKKAVSQYLNGEKNDIDIILHQISLLHEDAKHWKFNWVLADCTPEWSQKNQFLSNWGIGKVKSF